MPERNGLVGGVGRPLAGERAEKGPKFGCVLRGSRSHDLLGPGLTGGHSHRGPNAVV